MHDIFTVQPEIENRDHFVLDNVNKYVQFTYKLIFVPPSQAEPVSSILSFKS